MSEPQFTYSVILVTELLHNGDLMRVEHIWSSVTQDQNRAVALSLGDNDQANIWFNGELHCGPDLEDFVPPSNIVS